MPSPAPIRIRIGASVDASYERAFQTAEQRAIKAQERIASATSKATEKAQKSFVRSVSRQVKALEQIAAASEKAAEIQIKASERVAAANERNSDRSRRAATRSQQTLLDQFARRTSHRATRFLLPEAPIGSMAMRGLGAATRGMGVDTHLTSVFGALTEQERIAAVVSNKAYIKGAKGPAGTRVNPQTLVEEQRSIAKEIGGSTLGGMQAMEAFVNQRGNLAGWRVLAKDLTKRAISQGGDPSEIGLTAAKIDSALSTQGEFANNDALRNKAILSVLDNLIVQGKVGSIDFDKMSKEIPKLSGIAAMMEGDTGKNIQDLMSIAQLAERGPAKNAATASTFTQNFALDIVKRADKFKDLAGVNVFSKDGKSLRNVIDILVDTIASTADGRTVEGKKLNGMQILSKILTNKRSYLAAQEFYNVYKGAGGGAAGKEALLADLGKFKGSATDQVEDDLRAVLGTTGNKAERFNASFQETIDKVKGRLVPALEGSSGAVIRFAEVVGNVATWAVENPKTAIAGALSLSIARAGIESALRTGIETMIAGAAGSGGAGGYSRSAGFLGGVGLAGNLAAAATIASLTVTTLVVGTAIIDQIFDKKDKENKERVERSIDTSNLAGEVRTAATSGDLEKAKELAERRVQQAERDVKASESEAPGTLQKTFDYFFNHDDPLTRAIGTAGFADAREGAREGLLESQRRELASAREALQRIVELMESGGFPAQPGQDGD